MILSWVFFKVTSSDSATAILKGMCGLNWYQFTRALANSLQSLGYLTQGWIYFEGIQVNESFPLGVNAAIWTPAASFIALAAPNVCQIMHRYEPAFETYPGEPKKLNTGSLT